MGTALLVFGIVLIVAAIGIGIPAIHILIEKRRILGEAQTVQDAALREGRKQAAALISQAKLEQEALNIKLEELRSDEKELAKRLKAAVKALGQQTDLANSKAAILEFVNDDDLLDSTEYQRDRNEIRKEIKKRAQDAVVGSQGLNTGLTPIKYATIQAKADLAGALLVTTSEMLAAKVTPNNGSASMDKLNETISATEALVQAIDSRLKLDRHFAELLRKRLQAEFDHKRAKALAAEKQREIREQEREERLARQEAEKAAAEAKRDLEIRERALAEMKAEMEAQMAVVDEARRAEMQAALAEKQAELEAAIAASQRTAARAESTKQGHVYIISNIGSFGEGVYKIGMTRRLNPLDRVKELGDASVPFCFDVHALIECDDAPGLENALHHAFNQRRLNKINHRKEFFRVSMDEIQSHLDAQGISATINLVPSADEYYASLKTDHVSEELVAVGVDANNDEDK